MPDAFRPSYTPVKALDLIREYRSFDAGGNEASAASYVVVSYPARQWSTRASAAAQSKLRNSRPWMAAGSPA